MQIDYFTIIAQIINFLILVFLLKHFLYGPIIKSMNKREQKISSQLSEAEKRNEEARQEAESYAKKLQELSDKSMELQAKAENDARALQSELIKKAREDVEAVKAEWYLALQQEEASLLADLSRKAGEEVYAVVRRALQDLADEDLERKIVDVFIKRLQNMTDLERENIMEFYKTNKQIVVRSTFEIKEDLRQRIRHIVQEQIVHDRTDPSAIIRSQAIQDQSGKNAEAELQFQIMPDLICGVELSIRDMRIGWSIAGYLDALGANLSEALGQKVFGEATDGGGAKDAKERR